MTHNELVQRAVHWLLGAGGCNIAFSEFATSAYENPDAIGFKSRWSVLVECKVSRNDFFADRKKNHRRNPQMAMGSQRYFMVPAGLVTPAEVPEHWGLLYVTPNRVKRVLVSGGFGDNRAYMAEIGFLVSMLRRVKIRAVATRYETGNPFAIDFLNQWIKEPRPR